jgi:hypothetical protein
MKNDIKNIIYKTMLEIFIPTEMNNSNIVINSVSEKLETICRAYL